MNRSKQYVRGACDVLGIELTNAGRSLAMTKADLERLAAHVPRRELQTAAAN